MDRTKRLLEGIKNAGRSEVIPAAFPPNSFPSPVILVNLDCEDENSEMVTVYLFATRENEAVGLEKNFAPYLVAKVEWGTDGFQHQAEIDYVRGSAFSVTASYLRVTCALDAKAFLGTAASITEAIRAAATVSYGTRPGGFAPTKTLWFRQVPPTGVNVSPQEIPAFAKDLSLVWSDVTFPTPPYGVVLFNAAGQAVSFRYTLSGFGDTTQSIPIPSDAVAVSVINPVTAPLQDFRIIANLAF